MTTIKLFTRDQEIFVSKNPVVTTGNKGTVSLIVDFDSMWDGFTKSAVFRIENGNPTEVPFIDGKCSVPRIEKKCSLYIGMKGTKVDGTTKVSMFIKYKIEEGANGVYTYEPTDEVYQEILRVHNVLLERLNNLTKLEEGSTTGDAELQDIRIGYNGTVYDTAGEAVREQISSVNNNIMQSFNSEESLWEAGYIYGSYGSYGNYNEGDTIYRIRTANYLEDNIIQVVAMNGYSFCVFAYDENNNYIGEWNGSEFLKEACWSTNLELPKGYKLKLTVRAREDDKISISPHDGNNIVFLKRKIITFEDFYNNLEYLTDKKPVVSIGTLIGNSGGLESPSRTRVRSNYMLFDKSYIIACNKGYKTYLHFYNEEGYITGVGWFSDYVKLSDYIMLDATKFRVVSAFSDDSVINDITAFSKNIAIYKENILLNHIFHKDIADFYDYTACKLPILYLDGDIVEMSKDNAVSLSVKYGTITDNCTCKWQGSSSVRLGYPKRNYTIKFENAFEAKSGWGEQKKYCMKANWIDPSATRNVVNARLWGQIVKSRSNLETKLETAPNGGAIDGFPVLIVINGVYQGLYTFNIPKDGWMFGMGSGVREYLLASESNSNQACLFKDIALLDETDFSVEYAPEDVEVTTIAQSFNTLLEATINAHEEWEIELEPYLDIDSVFDYFIFINCIGGIDNLGKNILYGTYNGTKWFMSAYDLDSTYGSDPYGTSWNTVVNNRNQFAESATMHRLAHLIYKYSPNRLKERYKELRSGILSDENVWYMLTNFVNDIPKGIYDLDAKTWTTMPATSTANIFTYMEFYRMHCAYLDKEIDSL